MKCVNPGERIYLPQYNVSFRQTKPNFGPSEASDARRRGLCRVVAKLRGAQYPALVLYSSTCNHATSDRGDNSCGCSEIDLQLARPDVSLPSSKTLNPILGLRVPQVGKGTADKGSGRGTSRRVWWASRPMQRSPRRRLGKLGLRDLLPGERIPLWVNHETHGRTHGVTGSRAHGSHRRTSGRVQRVHSQG